MAAGASGAAAAAAGRADGGTQHGSSSGGGLHATAARDVDPGAAHNETQATATHQLSPVFFSRSPPYERIGFVTCMPMDQ